MTHDSNAAFSALGIGDEYGEIGLAISGEITSLIKRTQMARNHVGLDDSATAKTIPEGSKARYRYTWDQR